MSAPPASASSTASAIRGVQCFMPVKTGKPSSSSSAARVCLGDRVERRRPPESRSRAPVALDEVLEQLRANRPAAADVGVVRGDVLEPVGRPVRHQDDRGPFMPRPSPRCARARARRAGVRTSGSVSGRTPWPRLKMWPGRPPARAEHVAAPRARRAPTARAGRRDRGSPARRGRADARPALVERDRQSRPITSPPAAAIVPSRCAVPVPKWIVGTSTRLEDRAPSTARRTPRSRRREGADPGVEELDRVGAGARPWRAT